MSKTIAKVVATGLFSGLMKPFPGTWGTLPALAICMFILKADLILTLTVSIVTLFVSVWAAGEAEMEYGHDARKIVIDEWAGMFFAVIFVPFSYLNFMIAFVWFRLFDVVKIPPARQFERLPGGWGITMDDIVAGIQACVATHLTIYLLNRYYF